MEASNMLSVRKQEVLQNGVIGIVCVLISVLEFFTNKDLWAMILLISMILIYVVAYIYRSKVKNEPWDELTTKNYANARRLTLYYVEFTLLIWSIICIIGRFHVPIKASNLLFYYGTIKLVQTVAFLYYDSHIME